jgi:hypothetical protein
VTATLRVPDGMVKVESTTGRHAELATNWPTVLRASQRAGTIRVKIQRTSAPGPAATAAARAGGGGGSSSGGGGAGRADPTIIAHAALGDVHDDTTFSVLFPVSALPPGVYAVSVTLNGQQFGDGILFEARESTVITSIAPPCSPTFEGPPIVISGRRFGGPGSDVRVRFRAVVKSRVGRSEPVPMAVVTGALREDGKIDATPPSATFDGYFAVAVSFNGGVSFSEDDVHENPRCGMSFYRPPHLLQLSPALGSASGGYPVDVAFAFRYSVEGPAGRVTRDVPTSETHIVDEGQIRIRFVVVPRAGAAPAASPVVVCVVPAVLDARTSTVRIQYPRDMAAEIFRYCLSDTLRVELALNGTTFAGALEYITCRPVQIAGLSVGYGPAAGGTEVDIILAEGILALAKYDVRVKILGGEADAVCTTVAIVGTPSTSRRPRADGDLALGAVCAITIVMPRVADAYMPRGRSHCYARVEVALNGIDFTESAMGVNEFIYYKTPVVESLLPSCGPWTGGTLARVHGELLCVVRDAAREGTRRRATAAVRYCLDCFESLQSFPTPAFIKALGMCHLGALSQIAIQHTISTIEAAGRCVRAARRHVVLSARQ